jgi:hypothetical protein
MIGRIETEARMSLPPPDFALANRLPRVLFPGPNLSPTGGRQALANYQNMPQAVRTTLMPTPVKASMTQRIVSSYTFLGVRGRKGG